MLSQDCANAAIYSLKVNLEKVCPVVKFYSNQLSVCNRKCICHICRFEDLNVSASELLASISVLWMYLYTIVIKNTEI